MTRRVSIIPRLAGGLLVLAACGDSGGGGGGGMDASVGADTGVMSSDGQVISDGGGARDGAVLPDAGQDAGHGGGADASTTPDSGGPTPDAGTQDKPIVLECGADYDPSDCPVCSAMARCDTVTFSDQGDGTVRSSCCGLVWQKVQDGTDRTWAEANAYCKGLTLAGGGWRLPSVAELVTIVKKGVSPTVDGSIFQGTTTDPVWSSTDNGGLGAYEVDFSVGAAQGGSLTNGERVRCVR